MFERFTEEARQVVVLAQEEARGLAHNYIGTEHLLLGLLREENGVAARVLDSLGIALDPIRERIRGLVGAGEEPSAGQVPFTPRAKKVLELALREALSLAHDYIGTEHLLLGLARENEGVAARVLLEEGVDSETLRNQTIRALPAGAASTVVRRAASARASATGHPRPVVQAGWLDGFAPLMDRVADDIRRAFGREPDAGDLLLVLACAQGTLPGRALSAVGIDLDALWGTVEQLRREASIAASELQAQIDQAAQAKALAIDEKRFEVAAGLRDEERRLRERASSLAGVALDDALGAIRRRLGVPGAPGEEGQAGASR